VDELARGCAAIPLSYLHNPAAAVRALTTTTTSERLLCLTRDTRSLNCRRDVEQQCLLLVALRSSKSIHPS
jgi:hypothetical protein